MELFQYFNPLDNKLINNCGQINRFAFGKKIIVNTESSPLKNLNNVEVAIIGIPEARNSLNKGCALAPDNIRKYLYELNFFGKEVIADLGNIRPGATANDTYFAVRDSLVEILDKNIIPVLIGGSQDLTYAAFMAYEKLNRTINIASVDARFDLGDISNTICSTNYLGKIITQKSNSLFNFSNIGYQSFYVSAEETDTMKNILFDFYRLGFAQSNLKETEPVFRDASLVSFDISSIRQSDAPGHYYPSPNGFYGEEACQMARYAGLSDKVSCFGIFETNPDFDLNGQTSHLSAEIIWHFLESYFMRGKDYPCRNITEYQKHIVKAVDSVDEFIFYNNPLTDRWWMEVPYQKSGYAKSMIISCSQRDYETACHQEIPDRWWRTFQKIC